MSEQPKKPGYRDTLNLPDTAFPMKADLTDARADAARGLEGRRRATPSCAPRGAGRPVWLLHDGPPYSNGHLHMGTAANKIWKDAAVRQASLAGSRRAVRAGLGQPRHADRDAGRPRVRREEDQPTPARTAPRLPRVRRRSGSTIQRDEFKRLGGWGDWYRPYLTMAPGFEAEILETLRGADGARLRAARQALDPLVPDRPHRARHGRDRVRRTSPRPRSTCASRCAATRTGALARLARRERRGVDHDAVDAARQPRPDGGPARRSTRSCASPATIARGRGGAPRAVRRAARRRAEALGTRAGRRPGRLDLRGAVRQRLARRGRHAVREHGGRHRHRAHRARATAPRTSWSASARGLGVSLPGGRGRPLHGRGGALRGPQRARRERRHRQVAGRARARCCTPRPSRTPTRTAGAAASRSSSAPRTSGS